MLDSLLNFLTKTGVWQLLFKEGDQFTLAGRGWMFNTACWQTLVMLLIVGVLVYLAIRRGFEPLLLLPIAVGMLLTNLPGANIFHLEYFIADEIDYAYILHHGGFLDMLYLGVKLGIYPCLIFIGIGAMTDFSPLIANPKSLLIGAGAQLGVFIAFATALLSGQFSLAEAMSIGITGGADGPTAILVTKTLAPVLLGGIAIAAYSYMALIPMIQPPFMRLLTTKKERAIRMEALRPVSKLEKILFPLIVTAIVGLIVPDALVLIGCLMFGNLLNVCGVTDRLSDTVQNALMNIITIMLSTSVGATMVASNFLKLDTIKIVFLGLVAFGISTAGGLIGGNIMCKVTGKKVNPLIGSAGVSAVPMAARVSQVVGQKENPANFLLMHAMGPNVAGVIGSAIAAGFLLAVFG